MLKTLNVQIVNGVIDPPILVDVGGRVLAKCPQCKCEYRLDEHVIDIKNEVITKLAKEIVDSYRTTITTVGPVTLLFEAIIEQTILKYVKPTEKGESQ